MARNRTTESQTARAAAPMAAVSTLDLQRELSDRTHEIQRLLRRRDHLKRELVAVDEALLRAGWNPFGNPRGKRRRNPVSLVRALEQLLTGRSMSVIEAANAVRAAGYQTTSPNFRIIVNERLLSSGKFRRVSPEVYTAR